MSHSHPFLKADIPQLVRELKLEEKIELLGAPNWWNTNAIPRLGIPAIRMSDGPNGVRGSSHLRATPAQCLPCATSIASTFDPDLVYQVGRFLGDEARVKSATVLLAPTCNIQRSPLGGRSFESFSEDPFLSGLLAAAYVNGVQSKGVSATIKHFVANDQEHERTAVSSELSERALREVYLYPFMMAQKLSQPWAYMTAYNRVAGLHCSEDPAMLQRILRDEWKFDGLVMSDWFGTYSVAEALNAGLDLEMPGPPRWRTKTLVMACLGARKILPSTLDKRVENILRYIQKVARASPEIVYGDMKERTKDTKEGRLFCRMVAAEGIVLLKNDRHVLPIKKGIKKIAVIGPNAAARVISGGGSAALKPSYVVTPLEGLTENAPKDTEILYSLGCHAHKFLPTIETKLTCPDGKPGWVLSFYNHDSEGKPLDKELTSMIMNDTSIKLNDFLPEGLTPTWTIRLRGWLTVDKTMPLELGLAVAGKTKLWVNDKLAIDMWEKQRPGEFFYGQGSSEEKAIVDMIAGQRVKVTVEYTNTLPEDGGPRSNMQPALMRGLRFGGAEKIDRAKAIKAAADLAADCDVAIVVVGLNSDWESEGFDRPTLELPMKQDELIESVARANPNTVVVVQAGSAVSMPWASSVASILQTWHTGNETGNAIADVIYGQVNPSGRLPITFPAQDEDIPSFLSFGSENGKVHYREDIFVGYKHYQARKIKPLFPFGHGLSYTTFDMSDLVVERPPNAQYFVRQVTVKVTNTGSVVGSEVVQVYVTYPPNGTLTPKYQLKGLAKVHDLAPGESRNAKVTLDKYSVSFWDTEIRRWRAQPGSYEVHVGTSSENLVLAAKFELAVGFEWIGL